MIFKSYFFAVNPAWLFVRRIYFLQHIAKKTRTSIDFSAKRGIFSIHCLPR